MILPDHCPFCGEWMTQSYVNQEEIKQRQEAKKNKTVSFRWECSEYDENTYNESHFYIYFSLTGTSNYKSVVEFHFQQGSIFYFPYDGRVTILYGRDRNEFAMICESVEQFAEWAKSVEQCILFI